MTKNSGLRTFKSEYPKKFATVGDLIKVEEPASVNVRGIETSITPWISPDRPELLSVGKRINEGHSFVWPQRGNPFFTNEDGTVVRLQTQNNNPYINNDTQRTSPSRYESDIVTALNDYNYDQQPKRKGMDVIAPAVERDETGHSQSDSDNASEIEEEPLSPAQR